MTYAYDKLYLDDAMNCLGEAVDYAVNDLRLTMEEFMSMFIGSGYASQFELGAPQVVAGSGVELVWNILMKSQGIKSFQTPKPRVDGSREYWCGWILAFYQWYTRRSFAEINKYLGMDNLQAMYPTLHEAPELKFVDAANNIIKNSNSSTRLQTRRKAAGLSQSQLAKKSGVNIRTIQQYESGAKDINKAAGMTLLELSSALHCRIEDIMEPNQHINVPEGS